MARFIPDIVGLRAALDSKASTSTVENIDAKLEKKSEKGHGHSLREIAGLILALAGKASVNHRHDASTVTFSPADPSDWDGSPGVVSGALNQLSDRIQVIEDAGGIGGGKLLATVPRGEAISGGRAVYLSDVSGTVKAFRASATDTAKWAQGFVIDAGAADAEVDVWELCDIPGLSGIVEGAAYFLGNSGEFVVTPPSGALVVQRIGLGVTSTQVSASARTPTFVS